MLANTAMDQPALRMVHRYVSPSSGPVVEVVSLRRPEILLRHTRYSRVVVDERMLSQSFGFVAESSRCVAVVVLAGTLEIHERDSSLRVGRGEAVLLNVASMPRTRWDEVECVDLEWTEPGAPVERAPERLHAIEPTVIQRIVDAMADEGASQRSILTQALALFRGAGASIHASLDALPGEPTERDRRVASAMEHLITHLADRATAAHLAELTQLSPRQLQRVVEEFNLRYGINARTWRDTRNRWRLMIAVVLLSRPQLTVAEIAFEVGYGSPNALARAFAQAGLAPPAEVRATMSDKDPLSA